jgi:dGTPase
MPKKNIDTINKLKMTYLSPLQYEPLGWRVYDEDSRDRTDGDFQRDYTRIMYSSSFRRLQGKMQLLGIKNDQFFRNRLTHSLEVAQIARSIAARIGYSSVDTYVVEAGALSHDLGNPPFGHYGERVLNKACSKIGGFEGNAQTLRILTTIEKKRPDFRGLNLTFRTLLSVTKYFNRFESSISIEDNKFNKQKFIYDDDYQFLKSFIDEHQVKTRTLDVQIVDIADEIAYAAHDLEDGLRQKLFTIDEILHDYEVVYGDSQSFNMFKDIVNNCKSNASKGLKKIESSEYSKLFRKELVSSVIYTLIHDIDLVTPCENKRSVTNTVWDKEIGFSTYAELSSGLKKLTFQCINHNDEVYFYEQMGGKIIKDLFKLYLEHPMYLPPEYRAKDIMYRYDINEDENILQTRLIADYIAGMMDSFAISTYKKFFGINSLDSLF